MNLKEQSDREITWRRQFDPAYQAEELILGITEAITARMEEQGLTRAALAKRLNVSPAQVSKLLNADSTNFTIKTLARIAAALNVRLEWDFQPLVPAQLSWICPTSTYNVDPKPEEFNSDALLAAA